MNMTSNKPYLIRAIYDWIVDNNLTPHILVNAEYPGVQVPLEHVNNGKIVLNISPEACRGLHMENDRIVFTARFSGVTVQIFVVPAAIFAIYAKENGRGMEFGEEYNEPPPPPSLQGTDTKGRKPALTLVKKE
ncbi:MAG: ClpXP protease specificity-enhancing factor [Legionella sp.]|nr:ClpXP protease specificity-enhancing factor [Legionella sp.]